MTTTTANSTPFEWKPDYTSVLEGVAANDTVSHLDWELVRHMIKHKIKQNIEDYLSDPGHVAKPPPSFAPETLPTGWMRLPPFPTRQRPLKAPVNYMDKDQAEEMRGFVFEQLDGFDAFPFTIQRVCELSLRPKEHYMSAGKYLRAMEKALLVTSTWDSFPPLTEKEKTPYSGVSAISTSIAPNSAPSTPLFSPIPFTHSDARRSKSRSPPPSPLALGPMKTENLEGLDPPAIGLVDELDDPSPGHMSDRPTALTSTTTTDPAATNIATTQNAPPLENRFVRGTDQENDDHMDVDEDKENTAAV